MSNTIWVCASYVEYDASCSREILTIFHLVTLNDVSLSSKINGSFRHNHIAIYDFTATWFSSSFLATTMILITMIPSIQKNVYDPFVCRRHRIGKSHTAIFMTEFLKRRYELPLCLTSLPIRHYLFSNCILSYKYVLTIQIN